MFHCCVIIFLKTQLNEQKKSQLKSGCYYTNLKNTLKEGESQSVAYPIHDKHSLQHNASLVYSVSCGAGAVVQQVKSLPAEPASHMGAGLESQRLHFRSS